MLQSIKRILVVDDDPVSLRAIACHLTREGFRVEQAVNGAEARRIVAAQKAHEWPFDLVITDIRMPLVDGIELSLWLQKHQPESSILVITGFGCKDALQKIVRQSLDALCQKPVRPHELLLLLAALDRKRRALQRAIATRFSSCAPPTSNPG